MHIEYLDKSLLYVNERELQSKIYGIKLESFVYSRFFFSVCTQAVTVQSRLAWNSLWSLDLPKIHTPLASAS